MSGAEGSLTIKRHPSTAKANSKRNVYVQVVKTGPLNKIKGEKGMEPRQWSRGSSTLRRAAAKTSSKAKPKVCLGRDEMQGRHGRVHKRIHTDALLPNQSRVGLQNELSDAERASET
jgi:hypothetical protein